MLLRFPNHTFVVGLEIDGRLSQKPHNSTHKLGSHRREEDARHRASHSEASAVVERPEVHLSGEGTLLFRSISFLFLMLPSTAF